MLEWSEVHFPDGPNLRLIASPTGIRGIEFDLPERISRPVAAERQDANPFLLEAVRQLRAYFAGILRDFQLPLDLAGTEFQKRVWRQLTTIPYGETRSYSQLAESIGTPRAVRAVGAANGANPVAIVVPCHRVIGSSGKLVGYGGGLPLKQRLLALEGAIPMALTER